MYVEKLLSGWTAFKLKIITMDSGHIGKAAFVKESEQKQLPHRRSTSTKHDATKTMQSLSFMAKNVTNQTEIHSTSNSKENEVFKNKSIKFPHLSRDIQFSLLKGDKNMH